MSKALAAFRGDYGRVFLFKLDRELVVHAHREGHLLFHIDGAPAEMIVEDKAVDLKETVQNFVPWRISLRHCEAVFEHDCELAFDGVPFAH